MSYVQRLQKATLGRPRKLWNKLLKCMLQRRLWTFWFINCVVIVSNDALFWRLKIDGKFKNVRIYIWTAFVCHSIVSIYHYAIVPCQYQHCLFHVHIHGNIVWRSSRVHSMKIVACSMAPLGSCYWREIGYSWRVWVWMAWYYTWLDPYSSAVISACSINMGVGLLPTESILCPESWNVLSGNEYL